MCEGGKFAGFYGTTLQWQCSSECAWGICYREHQLHVSLHSDPTYHTIIGESVCSIAICTDQKCQ